MAKGDPIHEYKSASDNMRWYSNIRFAQITLFFALTAFLYSEVFSSNNTLPPFMLVGLKVVGIASALAFAYMERRADDYWLHFMARACTLEKQLDYKQYTTRPARAFATSTIILMLYGVMCLFWIAALVLGLQAHTTP